MGKGRKCFKCPVIEKGATSRKVVLPGGMWEYCNKAIYEGGKEIIVDAPISVLPYFIKKVAE